MTKNPRMVVYRREPWLLLEAIHCGDRKVVYPKKDGGPGEWENRVEALLLVISEPSVGSTTGSPSVAVIRALEGAGVGEWSELLERELPRLPWWRRLSWIFLAPVRAAASVL